MLRRGLSDDALKKLEETEDRIIKDAADKHLVVHVDAFNFHWVLRDELRDAYRSHREHPRPGVLYLCADQQDVGSAIFCL